MDLTSAPTSVRRLIRWLEAEGFTLVESAGPDPDAFGDQYGIWDRDGLRFEVACDRDEWSIGIQLDGSDYWAHPDEWEAFLDGSPLAGELSSLQHQVGFLESRFGELLTAATRSGAVEEVRLVGKDWAARTLGIFGSE